MYCPLMSFRKQRVSTVGEMYEGFAVDCMGDNCAWWVKIEIPNYETKTTEVKVGCTIALMALKK